MASTSPHMTEGKPPRDAKAMSDSSRESNGIKPLWGIYLHPSLFRLQTTAQEVLLALCKNGLLTRLGTDAADIQQDTLLNKFTHTKIAASDGYYYPLSTSAVGPGEALRAALVSANPEVVSFSYRLCVVSLESGLSNFANNPPLAGRPPAKDVSQATARILKEMSKRAPNRFESLLSKRKPKSNVNLLVSNQVQRTGAASSLARCGGARDAHGNKNTNEEHKDDEEAEDDELGQGQGRGEEEALPGGEPLSLPMQALARALESQLFSARACASQALHFYTPEPDHGISGVMKNELLGMGEGSGLCGSAFLSGLELALGSMAEGDEATFFLASPLMFGYTLPGPRWLEEEAGCRSARWPNASPAAEETADSRSDSGVKSNNLASSTTNSNSSPVRRTGSAMSSSESEGADEDNEETEGRQSLRPLLNLTGAQRGTEAGRTSTTASRADSGRTAVVQILGHAWRERVFCLTLHLHRRAPLWRVVAVSRRLWHATGGESRVTASLALPALPTTRAKNSLSLSSASPASMAVAVTTGSGDGGEAKRKTFACLRSSSEQRLDWRHLFAILASRANGCGGREIIATFRPLELAAQDKSNKNNSRNNSAGAPISNDETSVETPARRRASEPNQQQAEVRPKRRHDPTSNIPRLEMEIQEALNQPQPRQSFRAAIFTVFFFLLPSESAWSGGPAGAGAGARAEEGAARCSPWDHEQKPKSHPNKNDKEFRTPPSGAVHDEVDPATRPDKRDVITEEAVMGGPPLLGSLAVGLRQAARRPPVSAAVLNRWGVRLLETAWAPAVLLFSRVDFTASGQSSPIGVIRQGRLLEADNWADSIATQAHTLDGFAVGSLGLPCWLDYTLAAVAAKCQGRDGHHMVSYYGKDGDMNFMCEMLRSMRTEAVRAVDMTTSLCVANSPFAAGASSPPPPPPPYSSSTPRVSASSASAALDASCVSVGSTIPSVKAGPCTTAPAPPAAGVVDSSSSSGAYLQAALSCCEGGLNKNDRLERGGGGWHGEEGAAFTAPAHFRPVHRQWEHRYDLHVEFDSFAKENNTAAASGLCPEFFFCVNPILAVTVVRNVLAEACALLQYYHTHRPQAKKENVGTKQSPPTTSESDIAVRPIEAEPDYLARLSSAFVTRAERGKRSAFLRGLLTSLSNSHLGEGVSAAAAVATTTPHPGASFCSKLSSISPSPAPAPPPLPVGEAAACGSDCVELEQLAAGALVLPVNPLTPPQCRVRVLHQRILLKALQRLYLGLFLLLFNVDEAAARPASYTEGYAHYFSHHATAAPAAGASTTATTRENTSIHITPMCSNENHTQPNSSGGVFPRPVPAPSITPTNDSHNNDELASTAAPSFCRERRYRYLEELFLYLGVVFTELDDCDELGEEAVTAGLFYASYNPSLWRLRAVFAARKRNYNPALRDLELATKLLQEEKQRFHTLLQDMGEKMHKSRPETDHHYDENEVNVEIERLPTCNVEERLGNHDQGAHTAGSEQRPSCATTTRTFTVAKDKVFMKQQCIEKLDELEHRIQHTYQQYVSLKRLIDAQQTSLSIQRSMHLFGFTSGGMMGL